MQRVPVPHERTHGHVRVGAVEVARFAVHRRVHLPGHVVLPLLDVGADGVHGGIEAQPNHLGPARTRGEQLRWQQVQRLVARGDEARDCEERLEALSGSAAPEWALDGA